MTYPGSQHNCRSSRPVAVTHFYLGKMVTVAGARTG